MAEDGRLAFFRALTAPPTPPPTPPPTSVESRTPATATPPPHPFIRAPPNALRASVPMPPPLPAIVIAPVTTPGTSVYAPSHIQLMDHTMRSVMMPTAQPGQYKLQVFVDYYFYVQGVGVVSMAARMIRMVTPHTTLVLRHH